jgi:hypothetical protein
MQTGLMMRAAVGALLAAATYGGVAKAASPARTGAVDAAIIDAERVVSAENGVHAAPSGHVAAAPLAGVARKPAAASVAPAPAPRREVRTAQAAPPTTAASTPAAAPVARRETRTAQAVAPPAPVAAPARREVHVAQAAAPAPQARHDIRTAATRVRHAPPARLIRTSYADPVRHPESARPPVRQAAAPAPTTAPAAPAHLAGPHRLVVQLPDALVGPPQVDDEVAAAGPAPTAEAAPAPVAVAEASPPPAPLAPMAGPAPATIESTIAEAAADADASDAIAQGPSEEAAVYRRAAAGPAQADADQAEDPSPPADDTPALTPASDDWAGRDDGTSGIRQHVAFPRRSAEAAAAFDNYMHAVARIDAGFTSSQGVARALRTASAYDPHQLEEGMVAFGALAALQSPAFVYGVMDAASDPREREGMIRALLDDPSSAALLPGAEEAASLAGSAILRDVRPVMAEGEALRQASYDVQHHDWSIARAENQTGRLAQAMAASNARIAAAEADMSRLVASVSASARQEPGGRGVSAVTAHSLALAALSILGGAAGEDDTRLEPVVSEASSAACLRLSKLNLFQCLSVAGPEYEDVYCLAQHAVLDTGKCVAAGAASPMDLAMSRPNPRMSRMRDLR